ncbi:Uncharacterised protein [Listeria grayi]|uniref:Uncharacterized protein n=2 Tax=Listeria grayi TaxID=1641 RepID=A0A829R5V7_LISGR|nr:hypothetical protein [Listeria grayi]EUJ27801.1 hypothetical protein LMUR_09799 [Listeria grayi FSL F6-1183]STY43579.1 Uncharacterised protein [Listeria grayi]VEI34724.1 Uncharacterised protein [Listeria grayi]
MKNSSYSLITLLVIGCIFIILGLINIGISLFWDFSNFENMVIGIIMLTVGSIGVLCAYYWNQKK